MKSKRDEVITQLGRRKEQNKKQSLYNQNQKISKHVYKHYLILLKFICCYLQTIFLRIKVETLDGDGKRSRVVLIPNWNGLEI